MKRQLKNPMLQIMNPPYMLPRLTPVITLMILLIVTACSRQTETENAEPQAISLTGDALYPPDFDEATLTRLTAQYEEALRDFETDPANPETIIWAGRRAAYLWQYREAIDWFTSGIEQFPDDARLYRHRGHRYITVRQFVKAVADFDRAVELIRGTDDEIEPDGAPNQYGIPVSTLHFNIWYHKALAHYLQGDYEQARDAWEACMEVSENNDMLVATSDWLWITYRRLGLHDEAASLLEPIHAGMELLENDVYLKRLLMYKGEIDPDELYGTDESSPLALATQGYGVANYHRETGNEEKAVEIMREILASGYWSAFGYIAAEADLARGEY
ncbi:MAG: tetratricopeptide repeat protein [Balneolaceae bacterium]|nr:MAG: tetratricopeptide repeat protein [Balneolaceae bacterium]